MPFNLTRYNLQPYNAGGQKSIWLSAVASEKITAQTGTGTLTYIQCVASERVTAGIGGAQGRFIKARGSEVISELVTEAQMSVLLDAIAEEIIAGEAEQAAIVQPIVTAKETITTSSELGSNNFLEVTAEETVTPAVILGANIMPEAPHMYELVEGVASLVAIDTHVCIINTTLKPGQRLVIDAGTYNVFIDNTNAIHLHSGEWLDELNRETTEITVNARSGADNLTASILYTERYL